MKKILVIITLTLMSLNVFALSEQKLIDRCIDTAKEKFERAATKDGCTTDLSTLKIVALDNRTFNPFKYLMWEMSLVCPETQEVVETRVVTQYVNYEKKCY